MVKRHKRITDTKILRPFYEKYRDKLITLDKFAKSIHLGERQARRNFKKFIETGEVTVTRGFGSKNPYEAEDDFIKIFEMGYKGTSTKEIKNTFGYNDRKAYRHYNILTHLSKQFDCVISDDGKICSFTTSVICNCIKTKVISVVIKIDLNEKKISSKEVSIIPNKDLHIDGSEIDEYTHFVKHIIKLMFKTYFKKIKMREMLDRLTEDEATENIRKYVVYLLDSADESELCTFILNIKDVLFTHTNNNLNLTK